MVFTTIAILLWYAHVHRCSHFMFVYVLFSEVSTVEGLDEQRFNYIPTYSERILITVQILD